MKRLSLLLAAAVVSSCGSDSAARRDAGPSSDGGLVPDLGFDAGAADSGQPDTGAPDTGPPPPDPPSDEAILGAQWAAIPGAPTIEGKQDDLFFPSPQLGFSVNGAGNIFRTQDGGATWQNVLSQPGTYFRAIVFPDENRGFAGNIGTGVYPGVTDTQPMYETRDGGETWQAMTRIDGSMPPGICNFDLAEDGTLVASGRVSGPSYLMISSDGGEMWRSLDLNPSIGMLIDAHFFDARNGLVLGGSEADARQSRTVVLSTEDGGQTWAEVYRSERPGELAWKFSFPDPEHGFASVLAYNGDGAFLATTDGGRTWVRKDMGIGAYQAKGIGFINPRIGWVGGERPGQPAYRTADGGETWTQAPGLGPLINRFRFVTPRTGFAIGMTIHRLEIPE